MADLLLLRDHTQTADKRLDRVVGHEAKNRDYPVEPLLAAAPVQDPRLVRTRNWGCDSWYDQGQEGECVQYGFMHELRSEPVVITQRKVADIAKKDSIYHRAQHIDPWPGCSKGSKCEVQPSLDSNAYEGTSVSAGAAALKELGLLDEYRWAFSLEDALLALVHLGPLVVGLDWYEGMFDPDAKGFIHLSGSLMGGHCVCVLGLKCVFLSGGRKGAVSDLDRHASFVKIRQSWGKDHGDGGDVYLSVDEFDRLRAARGEICIPVRRAKG